MASALVVVALGTTSMLVVDSPDSHDEAPSGRGDPELRTAELLRGYFGDHDSRRLDEAEALLGDKLELPPEQMTSRTGLLVEMLWSLRRPDGGCRTKGEALYEAVVRELTAEDQRLARLALGEMFFSTPDDVMSEAAYARELIACAHPGRLLSEPPRDVIAFMGIEPGDTVADVGAGPGFWSFRFAEAAGEEGKVIALEVNEHMLGFLHRYVAERGITNVEVARGEMDDVSIPDGTVDHAWMTHMFVDIEAYYELPHREKLFGSVLRSLRRGGDFTVCEHEGIITPDLSAAQIGERLVAYGFVSPVFPGEGSALHGPSTFSCVRASRP